MLPERSSTTTNTWRPRHSADWSRCADGGEWAHATEVTLGAANVCAEA